MHTQADMTGLATFFGVIVSLVAIIGLIVRGGVKFANVEFATNKTTNDVGELKTSVTQMAHSVNRLTEAIAGETRDAQHLNTRFEGLERNVGALQRDTAVLNDRQETERDGLKRLDSEITSLRDWRHLLENETQALALRQEVLLRRAARELAQEKQKNNPLSAPEEGN